jgi:hypothetical protein
MALLRVDDPAVAVVQRRGFCHFASSTERSQELPNPEVGCVSVIGTVFEYWTGTAWAKFPPP